jgi:outer membrane protein OmpA-like peptidoglycan-associated protein
MKNKITLVLLSLLLVITGYSQKSMAEKRGDKFFDRLAYVKAADLYKRAAMKKGNDHVYERLGDCYRLMGQVAKSESWYGKVAQGAAPTATSTLYYSESLRANGKYVESQQWMSKYYSMKGDDKRAAQYAANAAYYEKIQAQQPYFDIKNISTNTKEADFGTTFYNDKVVFASSRLSKVSVQNFHTWNDQPFLNLYVGSRDANNGELSSVNSLAKKLNTKYHEGPACFTADGKTMYFTRNNYFQKKYKKDSKGINNLKIFRAKQNATGQWVEENLSINSDEFSVGHPALTADGSWMYFTSDMPGGLGATDIWRVMINPDGSLGTPENLGDKINTEGKEMFPFIDMNGNLLYSSDGQLGMGGLDVFYAPASGKTFGKLINLGNPINSTSDDFALVLDNTGKAGYFSSNREGGKGDDDIYSVTLLRPFKVTYLVKGIAKDKQTGAPLENTTVALKDAAGNPVGTVTTDATGAYQFEVDPKKEYALGGTKEKYFDGKTPFNTNELGDKTEIVKDVVLEKDPGLSLFVLVTEKSTAAPLEGVKVTIVDNMNNGTFGDYTTPATGDWRKPITDKKVGENVSYQIKLEKEGYLAKTVTFNKTIDKPGPLNAHESLDLTMDKISVGMDLAKIIDIKPIYFDLSKWAIRPDAAVELDKIVKVMNENPTMVIELGSHTDCRSSAASNMTLSDKRAKASAEYIKKRITNPERIYGKGYGETILVNGCACEGAVKSTCSEADHQLNRRTEFKIIKM